MTSYTHLRYSFTEMFVDLYYMLTMITLTSMSIQSTNDTLIVLSAVLASLSLSALLIRSHTRWRRQYFLTLGDRVLLARYIHRCPDNHLWQVTGASINGARIEMKNLYVDEPEVRHISVNRLYTTYTRVDPSYEYEDGNDVN